MSGTEGNGRGGEKSLQGVEIFASLSRAKRAQLEKQCRWVEFESGKAVIDRGDEFTDVYILTEGAAHVLNYSESGRVIDYAALGPGDIFGELAAIDELPRSASVATKSDCRLAVMPGKVFMKLVTTEPEVARALLRRMASIIRHNDERINDFSLLGAEQRVCLELLRMSEPDPGNLENLVVYPMPTQVNFANGIGLARETVGRIFSRLSRDGIIQRKDKAVYIRDRGRLEEMALF